MSILLKLFPGSNVAINIVFITNTVGKIVIAAPLAQTLVGQWRLVVKLVGRAARFHLLLNIWDCRHGCIYN